jgi:choline-sulfatase
MSAPNVLFLLSDEHSYRFFSHLDPSGEGEPARTPSFDALAGSSAVFHTTYCQMPLCTPSRMCMLTGREVRRCGAWFNGSYLESSIPTLPGVFAESGYETCLVGKMHFGGNRQFCGFRHRPYGDLTGSAGHQRDPLTGGSRQAMRGRTLDAGVTQWPESQLQEQIIARETLAFLREHRAARPDQPWLLCASFSRPHFPLTAPKRYLDRYWPHGVTEPKVGRTGDSVDHPMTVGMTKGFKCDQIEYQEMMKARAAYFACVDYLDEVIGDMLAAMQRDGLLDNTIVVYCSDHGEMAGEHGLWWKNGWFEACTRVPWLVQLPEHRSGELKPCRLTTPVSLADLFPTLCGLAGVPKVQGLDGHDLSGAIRARTEPRQRGPIFCDALGERWGEGTSFRMIRDGRYKYVAFSGCPELLFDLEQDPLEQRNLAVAPGDHVDALLRLRRLAQQSMDFPDATQCFDAAMQNLKQHAIGLDGRFSNLYLLPDGRLVDAELSFHEPRQVPEPAQRIADWPCR